MMREYRSRSFLQMKLLLLHWILGFRLAVPTQSELLPMFQTCLATPCVCCKSGFCTTSGEHKYPCTGCIDGFTGPDCKEPCPLNCFNCSQTYFTPDSDKVCYQCRSGYYNGRYMDIPSQPLQLDCSLTCKPGCEVCSSYNVCTKCKAGYFVGLFNTVEECTVDCDLCMSSETCMKCKDTFFWDGEFCVSCQPHCKICSSYESCAECDDNFVLIDDTCKSCPYGCASCSESLLCDSCREGFYLDKGRCLTCKDNCIVCSVPKDNSYTCNTCRYMYYNENNMCLKCRDNCAFCLNYDDCIACMPDYTEYKGVCYRCPDTCKVCSSNSYCMECRAGYYNVNGACYKCRDTCESCSLGEVCFSCRPGFYGKTCSSTCDPNCSHGRCDMTTGKCISCKEGYFFQVDTLQKSKDQMICKACPEHCTVCTNESDCLACENGYKGSVCQEECSNCKKGTRCEKTGGYCFEGCRDGLCGERCDLKCDSKCLSCDRDNPGKCGACAPMKFSVECNHDCSANCQNSTCHDTDGTCTDGCKPGYKGKRCEQKCKCLDKRCKRYSEDCSYQHSEYNGGDQFICPVNCICDDFGKCHRCNKSFGDMCSRRCSEGCLDEECDRDTGNCLKGCRDGYFGSVCDERHLTFDQGHQLPIPGIAVPVITIVIIVVLTLILFRKRTCCFIKDNGNYTLRIVNPCCVCKTGRKQFSLYDRTHGENCKISNISVKDVETSICFETDVNQPVEKGGQKTLHSTSYSSSPVDEEGTDVDKYTEDDTFLEKDDNSEKTKLSQNEVFDNSAPVKTDYCSKQKYWQHPSDEKNSIGQNVCARCHVTMYSAELQSAANKAYHTRCLTCSECRCSLLGGKWLDHKDELFCNNCYRKLFSTVVIPEYGVDVVVESEFVSQA